jgi:hypothetical protein
MLRHRVGGSVSAAARLALVIAGALVLVAAPAVGAPRDDRIARAGLLTRADLVKGSAAENGTSLPFAQVAGCEPLAATLTDAIADDESRVVRTTDELLPGDEAVTRAHSTVAVFSSAAAAAAVLTAVDATTAACAQGVAVARAEAEGRVILDVGSRDASGAPIPRVIVQGDILDHDGPGEADGWFAAFSTVPAAVDQTTLTGTSEEIGPRNSVLAVAQVGRAVAVLRFDGEGLGAVDRPTVEATLARIARRLARAQRR